METDPSRLALAVVRGPRVTVKAPPKDARYQSWISSRVTALKGEGTTGTAALAQANREWQAMKGGMPIEGSALPEPEPTPPPPSLVPAPAPTPPDSNAPSPPARKAAARGLPASVRERGQRNAVSLNTVGSVLLSVATEHEVVISIHVNPFTADRPITVGALALDEDTGELRRVATARGETFAASAVAMLAELRKRKRAG